MEQPTKSGSGPEKIEPYDFLLIWPQMNLKMQ